MTDLRGCSFRRLSSSAVFSSLLQKVAFEKILIIISAAERALLRPREDLRRVGEKFVGGLALTIIIELVLDHMQTSCRLVRLMSSRPLAVPESKENTRAEALILMRACL